MLVFPSAYFFNTPKLHYLMQSIAEYTYFPSLNAKTYCTSDKP